MMPHFRRGCGFALVLLLMGLGVAPGSRALARGKDAVGPAAAGPSLERAEAAFLGGQYARARQTLKDWKAAQAPGVPMAADVALRVAKLEARLDAAYDDVAGLKTVLRGILASGQDPKFSVYTDPPLIFDTWQTLRTEAAPLASATQVGAKAAKAAAVAPPPVVRESGGATAADDSRSHAQTFVLFVPFGVGHFAHDDPLNGAAFLAADAAAMYYFLMVANRRNTPEGVREGESLLSVLAPLTAYGLELNSQLPRFQAAAPETAASVSDALTVFPFGIPQFRNGDVGKGSAVAVAQGLALAAVMRSDQESRTLGMILFGLGYGYSVYDGWLHAPRTAGAVPGAAWRLDVIPAVAAGDRGGKRDVGLEALVSVGF